MDLSNLCKYYTACIGAESNTSTRVSIKEPNTFREVCTLDESWFRNTDILSFLQGSYKAEKELLIGYPILKIGHILSPVFILHVSPVSNRNNELNEFQINPELLINKDIIDRYSANDKSENLFELKELEDNLSINLGFTDLQSLQTYCDKLHNLCPSWEWRDRLDPYTLSTENLHITDPDGVLNRAILIAQTPKPYTVGLARELLLISDIPEYSISPSILEKIIHHKELKAFKTNHEILEVLPLNKEQKHAVQTAIASDITLISGPPGTGKTQVVANLIINATLQGKSILFTSKNNNAVDVVVDRVNKINPSLPWILRYGQNAKASISDFVRQWESSTFFQQHSTTVKQYQEIYQRIEALEKQKALTLQRRNQMDRIEQKVCLIRDKYGKFICKINDTDVEHIRETYHKYIIARSNYFSPHTSLLDKLFRKHRESKRKEYLGLCIDNLNKTSEQYGLSVQVTAEMTGREVTLLKSIYEPFIENIQLIADYNFILREQREQASMEQLDADILRLHTALQSKAKQVWEDFLQQHGLQYTTEKRSILHNYISALDLGKVDNFPSSLLKILPAHAITTLSARRRIPFIKGLYDILIIDEASQCDIASVLPLMLRAKQMVVIGDKQQLSHICLLNQETDKQLMQRYGITDYRWSYRSNSIYDLAGSLVPPEGIVQLRDHHRSYQDIIDFSNQEFYGGSLRIATDYRRLVAPDNGKPVLGMQWMNINGQTIRPQAGGAYNQEEVNGVIRMLRHLREDLCFEGSIGVTTPFRMQADMIRTALEGDAALHNALELHNNILIDTVHKFQGDEKDVILFSPVVSKGTSIQSLQFLKSTGNLFNVAITRARALLVCIGNKEYCKQCGVSYLEHFAQYNAGNNAPVQSSEWEHIFQQALSDAGIPVTAQLHVDKYYLDLAIFHNGKKLDIEIDGAMYHKDWTDELCYSDQLRNLTLTSLGWNVMRFWVQQVRDELPWCITQVRQWMQHNSN